MGAIRALWPGSIQAPPRTGSPTVFCPGSIQAPPKPYEMITWEKNVGKTMGVCRPRCFSPKNAGTEIAAQFHRCQVARCIFCDRIAGYESPWDLGPGPISPIVVQGVVKSVPRSLIPVRLSGPDRRTRTRKLDLRTPLSG